MVQDIVHNLCESLVENIGGVTGIGKKTPPTPITYLTQWKLMGNSEVHTDEYLTQWKVEGNSVVDNNTILSCGDLGQDGKYHVKISNGATIYDIPLTEPLRKVNDIADTIEFANGMATVTRYFASGDMSNYSYITQGPTSLNNYRLRTNSVSTFIKRPSSSSVVSNVLCAIYPTNKATEVYSTRTEGIAVDNTGVIYIFDEDFSYPDSSAAFKAAMAGVELIYELATPTTEVIQVSPFPISPTDTYTSVNDTPYSAFEYKKNVEIWSCGEYSEVDNKWHIRILPEGYGIVDIALDEPLRKVNDVADTIEFANGVGTLTRLLKSILVGDSNVVKSVTNTPDVYRWALKVGAKKSTRNMLNVKYPSNMKTRECEVGINVDSGGDINIFDSAYTSADDVEAFKATNADLEIIYELATPTTETIQVPQIQKADSYSCIISQGGKAVEWSSFETN